MPQIPDALLSEAYEQSARGNVLPALNPDIFFGYFSVCADSGGHGSNPTFPGLDWGQSVDALLWLGRVEEVLASWNYVRPFQRSDGAYPFAILPDHAGKHIVVEKHPMTIEPNGAVFVHWVPGNPFRALANVTFIHVADMIVRHTQNRAWLLEQLPYLRPAITYLASLVQPDGLVRGGGFYLERPTRLEYDGVNQGCVAQAFTVAAELMAFVEDRPMQQRCLELANRITQAFRTRFWAGTQCVEYIHPERGVIPGHGLTDVDWTAIATGVASDEQVTILWPQLRRNRDFLYSGIPTGIVTRPETYEDWEMQSIDRHDLAAMGRVWFLESQARYRMQDAEGLIDSMQRVARVGEKNNWHWWERYYSEKTGELSPSHMDTYVEYPATLIRVMQRYILGVSFGLDSSLTLAPCVPTQWWHAGFGQTLEWGGRELSYRFHDNKLTGSYRGATPLRLQIHTAGKAQPAQVVNLESHPGPGGKSFEFAIAETSSLEKQAIG